ncbi:hypothetical protein [Cyanobium sp. NIES-981]|uniref:hypothetical protein n=1 Tax=Cyanobium sp. NIES-981 TaxID=1851505 RepID=UPI0007DDCFB3|nr:hypothetical protein [Cyanobium sp. NIES-981]SBO43780.1 protein of unknown function [Cyanobium sp. NIES-981]
MSLSYTVWGDSHLIGFMEAVERMGLGNTSDLTFLPTPNVKNIKEIVCGTARSASLEFDGEMLSVELKPPEQSALVLVGNGNFSHFSVYERQGSLPPLWVCLPGPRQAAVAQAGGLASIPPVSMGLFQAVYAPSVRHNLLHRHGFTTEYFNRFNTVIVFLSPTPSADFFRRQLCSEGYLEANCLQGFKRAYAAVFELEVGQLGLRSVEVNYPLKQLEVEDGTTAPEYLLEEVLQVHGNAAYWESRIRTSSLL